MAKRIVTIRLEIEEEDYGRLMALPGPARTAALLMQRATAAGPDAVASAVASLGSAQRSALQTAQTEAATPAGPAPGEIDQ